MTETLEELLSSGARPEDGQELRCGYTECGNTYTWRRAHPGQRYCSHKCKTKQEAAKRRIGPVSVVCPVCGKNWQSPTPRKTLCSEECRKQRAREHTARRYSYASPEEAVRAEEERRYEAQIRRGVGRTVILAELLQDYIDRFPASAFKPHPYQSRSKRHAETMVVCRGDLHPGLATPSYNVNVFSQRMKTLTQSVLRIAEIISETIPLEKLVIFDLGDNVTGQGIFANQAWSTEETVMRQVYRVAAPEIIEQNLAWLQRFPRVEEYSVPGNHGRTGKEYPEEVNWDNVLAQEIAARMERVKNYHFEPNWNWWTYATIYDWRFLLLHGHQIRSWLNIPFYGLVNKGMRWQGSMPEDWHYLVHGHFHVSFEFPWNNFTIIGNGSMVSEDEFALRELGMSAYPSQQVFGVHPEHGVTWRYTLSLK